MLNDEMLNDEIISKICRKLFGLHYFFLYLCTRIS